MMERWDGVGDEVERLCGWVGEGEGEIGGVRRSPRTGGD